MRSTGRISNGITEGAIFSQLLVFFFPVLLGTLFQQLYNTVDAVIVGRFVGKAALAAVGGSSAHILNLIIGFFTGVSSGAAVITSQYYGARDDEDVSRSVHTAFILAAGGGAVMMVLGLITAPWLLELLNTPEDTMADSLIYLRIIYIGMVPSMVFNMGSATLRAVGDSRRPLYFLMVCCILNIFLDLLFVLKFGMGVMGVAVATIISQFISALLVCVHLCRCKDNYRLDLHKLRPDSRILRRTVHIGLPSGLQSIMYGLSNLILTAAVNSFGTDTVAAWVAMGKIDTLNWMTLNAMGISLMTFAGQNYGARKLDRVRHSLRLAMLLGFAMAAAVTVLFVTCGRYMLMLFTDDATVLEIAVLIVLYIAPWYWLYAPIEVFSGGFRGLGDTLIPTIITAVGVCVTRVLWVILVVPVWHDIQAVCVSYPISWALTSGAFFIYYFYVRKHRLSDSPAGA